MMTEVLKHFEEQNTQNGIREDAFYSGWTKHLEELKRKKEEKNKCSTLYEDQT